MKRKFRGLSTVLSTMILTSVLLVIVMSSSFLANNALTSQVENAEFDQAKDVMRALNSMVRDVMYKPSSSLYVKTGFRTTIPQLEDSGKNISAWIRKVDGSNTSLISECPINLVKIQGGAMVNNLEEDLVGASSVLLNDSSTPLGHVYIQRTDRAELVLDFSRVRCVYTGTLTISADNKTYNVIEVTFINMTMGLEEANERAIFNVKNLRQETSQVLIEDMDRIEVKGPSGSNEYKTLTELVGEPPTTNRTLVNLVIINVEVSLIGEA